MSRPTSVVFGRDPQVITQIIETHAPADPRILDVTYNKGVMWKKTGYAPHRADISREMSPDADTIADCRDLPFQDQSFDVIAFDPPHLPAAAASKNSSGIERAQYGLDGVHDYMQGDNIHPLFLPFLSEARRVVTTNGIIIVKIADLIHNHRYQWQHVALINAAHALGMTVCDLIIKADPAASNLKSSKWVNVHHFRRAHCYWLVIRPGSKCEVKKVSA